MACKRKLVFGSDTEDSDEFLHNSDEDPDYTQPVNNEIPSETEFESDTSNNNQSTRIPLPTPEKSFKGRKKRRNIKKSELNKKRRNEGRPYTSFKTGNPVAAAKIGDLCKCPLKCFEIKKEDITSIFSGFWDMSDFDKQNGYLFGCVEAIPIKRRYKKPGDEAAYKQNTFIYKVRVNGQSRRVCKKTFMSVHGLQNHRGRVNNIIKNIKTNVTPPTDRRGKHDNRFNRISKEIVDGVHEHIKRFPKYQSHYSRIVNPDRVYLGSDVNIKILYEKYLEFAAENNLQTVSEDKYRRIFNEEYNIGFKFPASDTCRTCDSLQVKIENGTQEEIHSSKREKELHLRQAEATRKILSDYSELAKKDPSVHVISVDLQQTLPTPKLTCSSAFYLRKLWTYNVGIHDCGKDLGFMFLWNEKIAGRGSDEVGSCILKYLKVNAINAKKLVLFTDNCGGQNKNWNIMALWSYLIQTKQFEEIEHWFLISGHTFLPSDRDFAKIEKFQRNHPHVYDPAGWTDLILKCGRNKKFIVSEMMQDEFFDLAQLKSRILNSSKKKCISGLEFKFSNIICFKFEVTNPWVIKVKSRVNQEFEEICTRKKGNTSKMALKTKYNGVRKIQKKKIDDIMKLLDYIPKIHHQFYLDLVADSEDTPEVEELE